MMTKEEKNKARLLYTELKNYTAVGRLLGYCSETIRVNLNETVKKREQKRWSERGSKTYHAKYKLNKEKMEEHRVKVDMYRKTERAKELYKKTISKI